MSFEMAQAQYDAMEPPDDEDENEDGYEYSDADEADDVLAAMKEEGISGINAALKSRGMPWQNSMKELEE